MREKKYANLLDVDDKKIDVEEKREKELSMTRELKFKDLQQAIDDQKAVEFKKDDFGVFLEENANANLYTLMDESPDIEVENVDVSDTAEIEVVTSEEVTDKEETDVLEENIENVELEEVKDEIENLDQDDNSDLLDDEQLEALEDLRVGRKKKEKNEYNDDLYLTTSFKPLRKKIRVSKIIKFFFKTAFIFILLGLFGYFILLPMYKKYIESKPVIIYENAIKYVFDKSLEIYTENIPESDKYYLDLDFDFESNYKNVSKLNNRTYGYQVGFDLKNNIFEDKVYFNEGIKEFGLTYIENKDNFYHKYSNSQNYFQFDVKNSNNKNYLEYIEFLNDYKSEDIKYFLNKEKDIVVSLLDEKLISSEIDKLEVNGKEIRVNRNIFTLKKNDIEQILKKYKEDVSKDNKLKEINNNLFGLIFKTEKSFEQIIDEYVSKMDKDYKLVFNLYTVNGTKVVGFDIEENGFRNVYIYFKDNNFNAHFNLTDESQCSNDKDCAIATKQVLDIRGSKDDNYTNIDLEVNESKLASLKIKCLSKEKVEFEYLLYLNKKEIIGDILLNINNKTYDLILSYKDGSDYINLITKMDLITDRQIGKLENTSVVEYGKSEYDEAKLLFDESLTNVNLLDTFSYWNSLIDSALEYMKLNNK